jgi:UDP-2,3-diacylglucosamine pyrophosphatase LpxH
VNQISPIPQISNMRQYRTIWISDIHLGTRGCKADFLVDFLRYNDADTIYLVGDIIDGWRLKRSCANPQRRNPEGLAQGTQGYARHLCPRQS